MYSELECGICYRTYNTGRRCPRELHCKHSFCESCLLALSRPAEGRPGAAIACPLCRHTTETTGEGKSTGLRVDESVLEAMMTAGLLEKEDPEEEEEECRDDGDEEATPAESVAEGGGSSDGSRGGSMRRTWRKVWRAIIGKSERRVEEDCMNGDDMRDLAMMSCYMF